MLTKLIVLKDELETTMRMMGVTDLSQVHPGMLNTGAVDHLIPGGEEHPYAKCEYMEPLFRFSAYSVHPKRVFPTLRVF